jgi:hypothetical protein
MTESSTQKFASAAADMAPLQRHGLHRCLHADAWLTAIKCGPLSQDLEHIDFHCDLALQYPECALALTKGIPS